MLYKGYLISAAFSAGNLGFSVFDGTTLTHEAWYYFVLRHILVDQACGNVFCSDTVPVTVENACNTHYPHLPGSCSNPSNQPDGEMSMNFIDCTIGSAKDIFKPDKKTRARTALLNSPFRRQMGMHGLCDNTASIGKKGLAGVAIAWSNLVKTFVRIE